MKKENRTSTQSTANQRNFILTYLREHGSGTTIDFRKVGIMSPAPRVMELKKSGYNIASSPETVTDDWGVPHKNVARYILLGGDYD